MQIDLERVDCSAARTIGRLTVVGGDFACWVCEDTVREVPGQPVVAWKVSGKTAIPARTYDVVVTMSARFRRELPLLVDVPGFTGIRIHPGNTAEDTEGCLLPGLDHTGSGVGRSRLAFDALFALIREGLARKERVTIRIS